MRVSVGCPVRAPGSALFTEPSVKIRVWLESKCDSWKPVISHKTQWEAPGCVLSPQRADNNAQARRGRGGSRGKGRGKEEEDKEEEEECFPLLPLCRSICAQLEASRKRPGRTVELTFPTPRRSYLRGQRALNTPPASAECRCWIRRQDSFCHQQTTSSAHFTHDTLCKKREEQIRSTYRLYVRVRI